MKHRIGVADLAFSLEGSADGFGNVAWEFVGLLWLWVVWEVEGRVRLAVQLLHGRVIMGTDGRDCGGVGCSADRLAPTIIIGCLLRGSVLVPGRSVIGRCPTRGLHCVLEKVFDLSSAELADPLLYGLLARHAVQLDWRKD